jgi:LAS superfamily LD-carboxypeptidase LdcB
MSDTERDELRKQLQYLDEDDQTTYPLNDRQKDFLLQLIEAHTAQAVREARISAFKTAKEYPQLIDNEIKELTQERSNHE